ncbi:hypothetical protein OU995_07560 [Roseateles sp. SL47]|uniref:hypothetical protein n=1 Tax=Roseateles sp. SL47 TaxID=2995138 RepID=UPI0022713B04|nr:hypothetical protein [Roseateles sp. SL47]WAC74553.1 hypothetical protein OU995_07560 [Roseateles sp. SL47]
MSVSGLPPGGNGGPGSAQGADAPARSGDLQRSESSGRVGAMPAVRALPGPGLAPPEPGPKARVLVLHAPLIQKRHWRVAQAPVSIGGHKTGALIEELGTHWSSVGPRLLAQSQARQASRSASTGASHTDGKPGAAARTQTEVEALRPHVASLVLGAQFDTALRSMPVTQARFVQLMRLFRALPPAAQQNRVDDLLREVMVGAGSSDPDGLSLIHQARDTLCPSPVTATRFLLRSLAFASSESQLTLLLGDHGQHLEALSPQERARAARQVAGRSELLRLARAAQGAGVRFQPGLGSDATLAQLAQWLQCQGHGPLESLIKEAPAARWSRLEDFAKDPLIQPEAPASTAWSALDVEQQLMGRLKRIQ